MAEPNDLHTGGETEHSNEEITEGVAMDVVAQPSDGGKTQVHLAICYVCFRRRLHTIAMLISGVNNY